MTMFKQKEKNETKCEITCPRSLKKIRWYNFHESITKWQGKMK